MSHPAFHDSIQTKSSSVDSKKPTRIRLRFRKLGDRRFIGHQDMLDSWERVFRRAGIPVRMSEGFHPKPIISSPLSLALGIVGWEELLEVELTRSMDEDEFLVRVQPELDVGMEIVSCQQCARNDKAKVVAVEYRIPLLDVSEEEVRQRAKRVLSDADVIVERKLPGQPPKHIKARPFLLDIRVAEGAVRFRVRAGGQGGLRAEEVLQLLNLRSLIDRGAILERTHVELAAAGVGDAALGN